MTNSVANKIRLLLNELAILNQPEFNSSGIVFSDDILLKIKHLSSDLYINVDFALNRTNLPENLTVEQLVIEPPLLDDNDVNSNFSESVDMKEPEQTSFVHSNIDLAPEIDVKVDPAIENEELAETEIEPTIVPEPLVESVIEADEVASIPEIESEAIIEAKVEEKSTIEMNDTPSLVSSHSVDIQSRISLTRRFEYINNLFGGDASAFSQFLKNISMFSNISQALEFFDSEFDKRNWKRKEESASEFRSLIKKALQ